MAFFESCAPLYIMIWVDRLSYMSAVSLKMPSAFAVWVIMFVRMEVQSVIMQLIRTMDLWLDMLCGSALFGLYMSLVALVHHFFDV